MAHGVLSKSILRKLFYHNKIGSQSLSLEEIKSGIPSSIKDNIEKDLKMLVQENLILCNSSLGGDQYSLDPKKLEKVISIIQFE